MSLSNSAISLQPSALSAWAFDSEVQAWRAQLAEIQTNALPTLAPGDALFVRTDTGATNAGPDTTLTVRYYHQDHLGSSSVLTDAAGQLVEETANYPFGHPRKHFQPRGLMENYGFTQKERDSESERIYFGARYYMGLHARFESVDAVSEDPSGTMQANPQSFNHYGYCSFRPLTRIDPLGNADAWGTVSGGHQTVIAVSSAVSLSDTALKAAEYSGPLRGAAGVALDIAAKTIELSGKITSAGMGIAVSPFVQPGSPEAKQLKEAQDVIKEVTSVSGFTRMIVREGLKQAGVNHQSAAITGRIAGAAIDHKRALGDIMKAPNQESIAKGTFYGVKGIHDLTKSQIETVAFIGGELNSDNQAPNRNQSGEGGSCALPDFKQNTTPLPDYAK